MADDFTPVPAEEWWRIRQAVRDLRALLMVMWLVLALLVVILFRKDILTLADLRIGDG